MKHYLLTFNENWADEHDVPALECFTEEEYNEWLAQVMGELNENYEAELKHYDDYKQAEADIKELNELGFEYFNERFI